MNDNSTLSINNSFFENQIVCEWLPSKEAATYLGISPNALRIQVCRGKIPAYKFGQRLRFRKKDLRLLLHRKE